MYVIFISKCRHIILPLTFLWTVPLNNTGNSSKIEIALHKKSGPDVKLICVRNEAMNLILLSLKGDTTLNNISKIICAFFRR